MEPAIDLKDSVRSSTNHRKNGLGATKRAFRLFSMSPFDQSDRETSKPNTKKKHPKHPKHQRTPTRSRPATKMEKGPPNFIQATTTTTTTRKFPFTVVTYKPPSHFALLFSHNYFFAKNPAIPCCPPTCNLLATKTRIETTGQSVYHQQAQASTKDAPAA